MRDSSAGAYASRRMVGPARVARPDGPYVEALLRDSRDDATRVLEPALGQVQAALSEHRHFVDCDGRIVAGSREGQCARESG